MTTEQRERLAYEKQLDWDLYNLSEVLSCAVKANKGFDDILTNKQEAQLGAYRHLWDVYSRAFDLKQRDWITETSDKTQAIIDLKSVSQQ